MAAEQQHTIAAQLASLPSLPMAELWALWDQHFPRRPSHRNRNYVESRLAYRIQELSYGALPTNVRKMLVEAGAKHSKIKSAAGRSAQTLLMPGTTLIREWEEPVGGGPPHHRHALERAEVLWSARWQGG